MSLVETVKDQLSVREAVNRVPNLHPLIDVPLRDNDDTVVESPLPRAVGAASALDLSRYRRREIRRKAIRSALVGLDNRAAVHYTQGTQRWSGINEYRRAYKGQYPRYADCSAFTTWCFWDAAKEYINKGLVDDFVNGYNWQFGYTGTQIQNGKRVSLDNLKAGGSLIFYGFNNYGAPTHVAIYVGDGKVVSHGSEGGPYLLRYNYRSINQARTYV